MNLLCWDPNDGWTGCLLCIDSPNPICVDRHCYPLLSFLLVPHQYRQSIPSHPIPSSAVINQNWIWAHNPIIKRLVWLGAISAAFVCVMFHWSSFLNLRVARRQMWVFKEHLWKGHCDSLLRTFKKMPLWPLTMWDPHVIHILRNILLFLYVPACIFETF